MKAKRGKNHFGYIFIGVGLVLLIGALSLVVYNKWVADNAYKNTSIILQRLEQYEGDVKSQADIYEKKNGAAKNSEMLSIKLGSERYIGVIEVMPLGIKLPVIATWNNSSLKIAPCRYKGTVKQGNLMIAGQNYERHFGDLKYVKPGNRAQFTDLQGNRYVYEVTSVDTVKKKDTKAMESGDWNLTLFTETTDGSSWIMVRCKLQTS